MVFSYAVRAVYVESCSMFVRGGVYRAVKMSLGGTLAKFSVSALMFDYILTGPISGVAAGRYLAGLIDELLQYFHLSGPLASATISFIAVSFAVVVTLYFWWQNTKGVAESSEKALQIMKLVTVMVVMLIAWCVYTVAVRHSALPPWPHPRNLRLSPSALGWLAHSSLPHMFGIIAIFIALGHSVLAMSGEESLAQVYREIESPKLPNLKKAGAVIFVYSLVFTSLVSFFAVMIIPDAVRQQFLENLIGGLAMNLEGPFIVRLIFHGFVVVVGTLILAGALTTAIVGSNGVLTRVTEDGVLSAWFRQPHKRFGTSNRIINIVVALQIITIIISRGNVTFPRLMMMVMICSATTILMMRWLVPNRLCGCRNHALSTPSSETRFSTPLEPTMAVFTAPARIRVPTTTTKPWNIRRTINGPSRFIASPPIRFSRNCWRTPSGMIITAKKETKEVKTKL